MVFKSFFPFVIALLSSTFLPAQVVESQSVDLSGTAESAPSPSDQIGASQPSATGASAASNALTVPNSTTLDAEPDSDGPSSADSPNLGHSIPPNGGERSNGKPFVDAKKKQEELKKKVAAAHKPVYYLNDFSYVLDPAYRGYQYGDGLKRRTLFRCGHYDIGGEYRLRQHSENNFRGLGLTGLDDDFLLQRLRLFGNFEMTENIRVFAEMIDARSDFQNHNPRGIEVNEYDMLNLFVDAKLWSDGDDSLMVRSGRQELLFGAQRVISPLDWANTRRTFDGYRFTARSGDITLDGFWTRPVFANERSFDSPELDQEFMGFYGSYGGVKDTTLDLYLLRYLNNTDANDYQFNTIGSRWTGGHGDVLWDFEGAFQGGQNTDGTAHQAGAFTIGGGRKLSSGESNPVLWLYFDWASGDDSRGAGNGYHHLFPLAHRFNGFMDLFGRRNLGDANVLFTFNPTKKWNMLVWYHYFWLANENDTPYSVVMTPFNPANAPESRELGHELDLLATCAISSRQQLQLGYSYFWSGAYYRTPGVPTNRDASFLYTQWSIAF